MTHHVRDAVKHEQANGHMPQGQMLNLDIVLPLRNQAGLDAFLTQLNDPTSAGYRQYLTPEQFTERFGPSQSDYDAVVQYAKTHGMNVTGGTRGAGDVQVQASVGAIESAFHVHMNTYKHPKENRDFYSPDAEPTTDLGFSLWHVSGLDNFSIPQPRLVNKNDYAAAHGISPDQVVSHATTGSGPSASFLGSDMRAAYYSSAGGTLTGAGQTVGLLEFYGTDLVDLTNYYKGANQTQPATKIHLLSTDGTSTSCVYSTTRCDDGEQNLDMTQALGMAPGLTELTMYIGSSDTAMLGAMVSPPSGTPLAGTIGCSWGWSPVDPSTLDPYFQRMQTQGQTFLAASGDSSTWTSSGRSAPWPADDPNVVSVGGTDLVTTGAGGAWSSETAWVDSGGGITPNGFAIPSWQQGIANSSNKASTTLRNGPDVSANANFTFFTCGDQQACQANYYGGTSFAAPMWAAYLALVNQQLAANGQQKGVGFINPTIYAQNQTSAYGTNFHDVTSGTSGSYSAVTGYDLVTGWGSPTPALVSALTGGSTSTTPDYSVSATNATVTAGSTGTTTISVTGTGGYSGTVSFSASGLPNGVSFGAGTATGTGTTTGTFTATSSATTGTFTVTITGTDGNNLSHSTTMTLTVNAAQQANYSVSATNATVTAGSSATSTITVTGTGGYSGTVSFSASGLPSGVSFGAGTVTGSGSTTGTFTASTGATAGSYTVTITGSDGTLSHSTTMTLTVSAAQQAGTFTLSANPNAVTVARGGSGQATISSAVQNGFNSSISLSASGATGGVSISFVSTTIGAGQGTTMTIRVNKNVQPGTRTITITGTGGGKTSSTQVTLTTTR